eukprot:7171832-Prorocentrum_lima.AAC.1
MGRCSWEKPPAFRQSMLESAGDAGEDAVGGDGESFFGLLFCPARSWFVVPLCFPGRTICMSTSSCGSPCR